jgi:hypothetical protein
MAQKGGIALLFLWPQGQMGWVVNAPPQQLYRPPPGNDPVHTVQEAGWTPGPVWLDAEYFAPTGTRSPDRPARSEAKLVYTVKNVLWNYCLFVCLLHSSLEIMTFVNRQLRFSFLGAFTKLRKTTISSVMSVRQSVRVEHLGSHYTDFYEIWYLSVRQSLSRKLKFL